MNYSDSEVTDFGHDLESSGRGRNFYWGREFGASFRFRGRNIALCNYRFDSETLPTVNLTATRNQSRSVQIDAKLEEGAKRMALALGIDLSK